VLAPTARGVKATGVETVMAAPRFPQPMYEALRDISQELLVPGLESVPPETVFGLKTNRPFVEAFMVGLNHEMGRELLWRGFPTDQRGTYFDHFWGSGVPNASPPDVAPLHTWGARPLGANPGAAAPGEEFVLLLRSTLLARYPNAVVYLTPAVVRPGGSASDPSALVPDETVTNERMPAFSGALHPDLAFFGFPVSATAAVGGPGRGLGYYVVIQEHPTEPRFGIGEGAVPPGASHLAVGPTPPPNLDLQGGAWNTTSAQMALITRRVPVRVAIHASRLIT
jgi:hypothetical protein